MPNIKKNLVSHQSPVMSCNVLSSEVYQEELQQTSQAQSQNGPPLVEGLPHSGSHSVGFFFSRRMQSRVSIRCHGDSYFLVPVLLFSGLQF